MWVVNTLKVPDPARCLHACLAIQSCPALCDPMDCSPPGSSVRGILQARILEWVTILFSRGSYNPAVEAGSPVWATSDAYIHDVKFSKAVSGYISITSRLHTANEKHRRHHTKAHLVQKHMFLPLQTFKESQNMRYRRNPIILITATFY